MEKLEAACHAGKVAELAGFGAKTQANILEGIERRQPYASQHLFHHALHAAEPLFESLRQHPDVIRCSAAGSLRRCKEIIGDIDLLASSKQPGGRHRIFRRATRRPQRSSPRATPRPASSSPAASSAICASSATAKFPLLSLYFTGSKEHNIVMRQRAIQRGLRLNEYGLFKSKEETRDPKLLVACDTEDDIFDELGLPDIPPEMREDHGEFAAAEKGPLPRLIEWTDLRGSLHNHSTWSDGHNTLEEIAGYMARTRP